VNGQRIRRVARDLASTPESPRFSPFRSRQRNFACVVKKMKQRTSASGNGAEVRINLNLSEFVNIRGHIKGLQWAGCTSPPQYQLVPLKFCPATYLRKAVLYS
jgi:hypothetical protein